MAYIQQRGERKYKITVCNGYKPNGQKRMQARTVDVPKEVPKRVIQQYVMAEAERLEKTESRWMWGWISSRGGFVCQVIIR